MSEEKRLPTVSFEATTRVIQKIAEIADRPDAEEFASMSPREVSDRLCDEAFGEPGSSYGGLTN